MLPVMLNLSCFGERFQQLEAEFSQHEEILNRLETQAASYRREGQTEASNRLEQQILLLKVNDNLFFSMLLYGF